jgi:hypothetical protein
LIKVFADVFRRALSGWGKAGWIIFVIVVPFLGVFIYLIADGKGMAERDVKNFEAAQSAQQEYIRSVAGSGGSSAADELDKLAALRDKGVLTAAEFEQQKTALLA